MEIFSFLKRPAGASDQKNIQKTARQGISIMGKPARKFIIPALLFTLAVSLGLALAGCGASSDSTGTSTAGAAKLQEFTSQTGRFSVMVPAIPEESVPREGVHDFTVNQGSAIFSITYNDYPADKIQATDPQVLLDAMRDAVVGGGKLDKETGISMDGYPGREIIVSDKPYKDVTASVKLHIYLVKNRLYQVQFTWKTGDATGNEMDESMQSFKVLPG